MQKVVAFLHVRGPEEGRDVDLIAARVALDAISRTGFGYEMGCCEDLGAPPQDTPYIAALDSSKHTLPYCWDWLSTFVCNPGQRVKSCMRMQGG